MTKSRKDQRQHRRKVAGPARGLAEHQARHKRRVKKKRPRPHVNKYKPPAAGAASAPAAGGQEHK